MAVKIYWAHCFHEFIEITEDIGNKRKLDANVPPVLWSRGHRKAEWNLLPTLTREVGLKPAARLENSSVRAVEEELRREHYVAKNYHFLQKTSQSQIEWMEVMQHHGVKTRLLDWSESVLHSLIFSLECFFDKEKYDTNDRIACSPCVWLLEPGKWNMKTLELLLGNHAVIDACLHSLPGDRLATISAIRSRLYAIASDLNSYMAI